MESTQVPRCFTPGRSIFLPLLRNGSPEQAHYSVCGACALPSVLPAEVPVYLQTVWGRTGLNAPLLSLKAANLYMAGFLEMLMEGMSKL